MRIDRLRLARDAVLADLRAEKDVMTSHILIPDVDASKEAYKSASEVAQAIGTDKIFKVCLQFYYTWTWLDGYSDSESGLADIFFYAHDKEDAKSRLGLLLEIKGNCYSALSDIVEVPKQEAEARIALQEGKTIVYLKELADHILALPTRAMHEEMKKSIDWAVNLLKKMKDLDEASKRAAWLETPSGKAWLAKYEADKALLAKLEKREEDKKALAKAKREQEALNEEDLIAILERRSEKYPQYKDGIAPVIVTGGKKWKGDGYAISYECCSGGDTYVPTIGMSGKIIHNYLYYHQDDEWTNAIIYDPVSNDIHRANIKFCLINDIISNEQCVEAFKNYCESKVKSTIAWCLQKDPSKPDFEIRRWAKNIIKKYHPWIDVDKFILFNLQEIEDAQAEKAKSTIDWAISLKEGQAKTERIILKSLAKKGIDYRKFEELITIKLQLAFGHAPKVIKFTHDGEEEI